MARLARYQRDGEETKKTEQAKSHQKNYTDFTSFKFVFTPWSIQMYEKDMWINLGKTRGCLEDTGKSAPCWRPFQNEDRVIACYTDDCHVEAHTPYDKRSVCPTLE